MKNIISCFTWLNYPTMWEPKTDSYQKLAFTTCTQRDLLSDTAWPPKSKTWATSLVLGSVKPTPLVLTTGKLTQLRSKAGNSGR